MKNPLVLRKKVKKNEKKFFFKKKCTKNIVFLNYIFDKNVRILRKNLDNLEKT